MATALRALAAAGPVDGLPAPRMVGLEAQATGWDIRFLSRAIQTLDAMPSTWAAFDHGQLSWSQLRGIVTAARGLCRADRAALDVALTGAITHNATAEPDRLVEVAEDLAGRLDDAAQTERDDRTLERRVAVIQPAFDGGFKLYAELGPEGAAVVEALDAAADPPIADNTDDSEDPADDDGQPLPRVLCRPTRRCGQLAEALIRICQTFLAGASDGAPARPQAIVIVDAHDLVDANGTPGGIASVTSRLLWRLAGGRQRLTRLDAQTLACDASLIPLVVDTAGTPTAIGDAHQPIGLPLRRAVMARDQGCRMPGCDAPAQYCDAHHIIYRSDGGPTELANLIMLCRRCHRNVHRHRWRLQLYDDGRLTVRIGRRTYTSRARLRAPPPTADPPDPASPEPSHCTATGKPLAPRPADAVPF